MKFLIVDDHKDMLPIYEHSAQLAGVEVEIRHNAYEALEFLGEHGYQIDAAILDLNMPYIDGLDLSDQIRLNEKPYRGDSPLPLFFYTGFAENDSIRKVKSRNRVAGLFIKAQYAPLDVLTEIKAWLGGEKENNQKGHSTPNVLVVFVAVILQIAVVGLFMWLYNKQDVAAAYRYSEMRNQRDQYKKICDSNLLLDSQKETWIRQQNLELPAQISGQTPCAATDNKEEK